MLLSDERNIDDNKEREIQIRKNSFIENAYFIWHRVPSVYTYIGPLMIPTMFVINML